MEKVNGFAAIFDGISLVKWQTIFNTLYGRSLIVTTNQSCILYAAAQHSY